MIACKPALSIVGDQLVENVRRDLRDRKCWARFEKSRTPGSKGGSS